MLMFTLAISCLTTFNLPWFMDLTFQAPNAILFFTALDSAFNTRHIHNWVSFPLWLSLFIPSGIISVLFSSGILYLCQAGGFLFQCPIFLPFHSVHGVLTAKMLSGLPLHSPMHHVLSELSNMTCLSWVSLLGTAHSLIELDKAVVHVIRLVSFLRLQFSVCLPADGEG